MTSFTLVAERYGKWLTCYFSPLENQEVLVWCRELGPQKRLSTAEARRMWRGMVRKGWIREDFKPIGF